MLHSQGYITDFIGIDKLYYLSTLVKVKVSNAIPTLPHSALNTKTNAW